MYLFNEVTYRRNIASKNPTSQKLDVQNELHSESKPKEYKIQIKPRTPANPLKKTLRNSGCFLWSGEILI